MNVLITSAGRRVALVRAFKRALGGDGVVVAADADPLAPAFEVADESEVVPRLGSPLYRERLAQLCSRRRINLVIPTIDTELLVLSDMSAQLGEAGTFVMVSDAALIEVAIDKQRTADAFMSAGIAMPRSWLPEELDSADLPTNLFVKPRQGSASIDTYRVEPSDLRPLLEFVADPIIQEYVDAPEVTVDVLLDLRGRPLHMVPRLRLKTVGGESVEGVTLPDEPIRDWLLAVLAVVSRLGGCGPITLQAFLTPGTPTLIEVNPRFGGGYPLAWHAGADYPSWILQMIAGHEVTPRLGAYEKGLFMTRALEEYIIDPPERHT